MKLIIKNDLGDFFHYECEVFEGYDVFTEANFHWGPHAWQTYTVYDGNTVLMDVINPNVLDPSTAHVIQ